ncbi:hypothetical protein [Streptomyces sp. TP-A0356]|uniref:hypothetical protein n=1 Tax=Streptomyces sp. TP-A0356 TaxID=1359208 RepID=UPI000B2172E9|nr:hypothetical protein [Streptomyces sp. TP-A0356]
MATTAATRRQVLSLLGLSAVAVSCGTATGATSGKSQIKTLRYQGWAGQVTLPELAEDLGYLEDVKLKWVGNTISGPQDIQSAPTTASTSSRTAPSTRPAIWSARRSGIRARQAAAMAAHARWMYTAALARTETRSMAKRLDFPAQDPRQHHRIVTGGLDQVWTRTEPLTTALTAPAAPLEVAS